VALVRNPHKITSILSHAHQLLAKSDVIINSGGLGVPNTTIVQMVMKAPKFPQMYI